jgi:hypothetical protein
MEAIFLTLDLILEKPLPLKKLIQSFEERTGQSFDEACSDNSEEFFLAHPERFNYDGEVVERAPPTTKSEWLAAAGRAAALPDVGALPEAFAKALEEQLCLDCKVHVGGSVGRATATISSADVDLVVTFANVPRKLTNQWAPSVLGLLQAMLPMITVTLDESDFAVAVRSTEQNGVVCEIAGKRIRVLVAPVIHRQHISKIDWSEMSNVLVPALDRPFTLWVRAQPSSVLHAIRVVKEWVSERPWSSSYFTPPQSMIDLLVIHVAMSMKTSDELGLLVRKVHGVLRRAEKLCVMWTKPVAWYEANPAMMRPLVMDPFHPTRNHADIAIFDPSELQMFARSAKSLHSACIEVEACSTKSFGSAMSSGSSTESGTGSIESDESKW